MDDVVEFVQNLPHKDPREILKRYGVLNVFAVWWAIAFVSLLIGWAIQRRHRHGLLKRCGIPGPEADSFIFGHYTTLKKNPVETLHKWSKQYGRVFGYYVGDVPFVNIADAEMVKEVFVKSVSIFNERAPLALSIYPMSQSLLCLSHQRWKKVRSVLTPAFSASKLKLMMKIINGTSDTMLDVVSKNADTGKSVCFFDLSQKVTLDVIASCALATKINCLHDDKDKLLNDVRTFLANTETVAYDLAHGVPAIEKLLSVLAKFTNTNKMMIGLVDNIKYVLKSRKKSGLKMQDMLQLMMDAAESEDGQITDEDIAANAFLFLLGGYETTAITLAMAAFLLAKYPEEQEKLYAEIKDVWNDDEQLSYEHVNKLKRTEAFLLETLRMYPPVITIISRLGNQDIHVGGYTIPKGVRVQAAVMEIHMDEKYWPEPETFNPERFLDTNASSQPIYLPFGVGPKMCLGKRFSLIEMKTTVAHLLKRHKLMLTTPSQQIPVRKMVNVSLSPEGSVPLLVETRP